MTNKASGGPASDRELLEMAAKAAGLPMCEEWDCAADGAGILIGRGDGDLRPWNPLDCDGDALRLAVCLGIPVEFVGGYVSCSMTYKFKNGNACCFQRNEPIGDDHCLATRRAIVRAAAAIGAGMAPFPTADEIRENWT